MEEHLYAETDDAVVQIAYEISVGNLQHYTVQHRYHTLCLLLAGYTVHWYNHTSLCITLCTKRLHRKRILCLVDITNYRNSCLTSSFITSTT